MRGIDKKEDIVPDKLQKVCYDKHIESIRKKLKEVVLTLTQAEQEELLATIKGGKLCSQHGAN